MNEYLQLQLVLLTAYQSIELGGIVNNIDWQAAVTIIYHFYVASIHLNSFLLKQIKLGKYVDSQDVGIRARVTVLPLKLLTYNKTLKTVLPYLLQTSDNLKLRRLPWKIKMA